MTEKHSAFGLRGWTGPARSGMHGWRFARGDFATDDPETQRPPGLERIANLQARNEVVRLLHENVQQFAHERDTRPPGAVAKLADTLTQGLSAVLMCLDDAVRDGAADDIALVRQISSDRSTVVDSPRRQLVRAGSQELVYSLTNLFERAVWLVQRYALSLGDAGAATQD